MSKTHTKGIKNLALIGGDLCLDLVNTVHHFEDESATDELNTYGALVEWSVKAGALDDEQGDQLLARAALKPEQAHTSLLAVRAFRRSLFGVLNSIVRGVAPNEGSLKGLEDVFQESICRAKLHFTNGRFVWGTRSNPEDLSTMLWVIAQSAEDLLTSPDLPQVRVCEGGDCTWMFVDRSRNGSRRWCQMDVCGNRAKARRHYERVRAHH